MSRSNQLSLFPDTRLRPFFKYFGSKWRTARKKMYPGPKYDTIVEPFAGGAGYSLCYSDREIILYDANPIVVSMWQYLINASVDEILSLPDIEEWKTVDDYDLPQGAKWLIGFLVNVAVSAPCKQMSSWQIEHNKKNECGAWSQRQRERIASQLGSIRHWKIFDSSYENIDTSKKATWFVDPPYEQIGKLYKVGSEKIDYANLSEWCKALPGQVIVCGGQHCTWLPFECCGETIGTTIEQGQNRRSKEFIWTNNDNQGMR